jgi:hypothetical protein
VTSDEREKLRRIRHDSGNALATARANLEAMIDGVLEPSPERIAAILESLDRASAILADISHL